MAKKDIKSKLIKDGEFIPPDGGWGWMIVIAAGFSNLFALPMIQQFGLLCRDKTSSMGLTSSQLTTIINVNSAATSCVGLANGPVFKTFSYRAVSLTGALLIFISLILTIFTNNFITYLICFAVLYGAGYGISSSATALALNTYWKNRRRLATSLSWTTTGLGPVLWPHIITFLLAIYGETGAMLILGGLSAHCIAFALLLHPVEWHSKSNAVEDNIEVNQNNEKDSKAEPEISGKESGYFGHITKIKNASIFSSQYLYNEDDPINTGYEITDPGVPMMIRSNDGYFSKSRSRNASKEGSALNSRTNSNMNSKKASMTNLSEIRSRKSSILYLNDSKKNSAANLGALVQEREVLKPKRKTSITIETQIPESEIEDCPTLKAPHDLKAEEKVVMENIDPEKAKDIAEKAHKHFSENKSTKPLRKDSRYGDQYNKDNHSNISFKTQESIEDKKYLRDTHSNQSYRSKNKKKSNSFAYESDVLKQASLKLEEYLKEKDETDDTEQSNLLISQKQMLETENLKANQDEDDDDDESLNEKLTFCQKIVIFFDFDLLKDFTFINLMLGITLSNFNEINFSILTPFLLGDYGISKTTVAMFMSLLAGVDICVRLCIPMVAGKIGWENNTFFLFGVIIMSMGRVVLAFNQDYYVIIIVAIMIGFGKGLRTVFMALVIPTHVPLCKLPGATGIQLMTSGFLYLGFGPIVGWIKDSASTGVTLYCLNIFTWLTAISWMTEKYYRSRKQKQKEIEINSV